MLLQASLFANRLVQDVWDLVNTLNSLREEHSNKQVRDQSLEALLAVLDQASYSKDLLQGRLHCTWNRSSQDFTSIETVQRLCWPLGRPS